MYRGGPLLNLFSIQDVNYHTSLKKNIGGLYTKAAVRDFEPQIDSCVHLFLDQLGGHCKDGPTTIDMSLWLHLFAFDCLGEVNVSKMFGFLKQGQDVRGMIAAADQIFRMVGLVGWPPSDFEVKGAKDSTAVHPGAKSTPSLKDPQVLCRCRKGGTSSSGQ